MSSSNPETELLAAISSAVKRRSPMPAMTLDFTLDDAYRFQHQLTAVLSPGGAEGIKAGVTTTPSQKALGVEHALLANLYEGSQLDPTTPIDYLPGRSLESEIAVLIDANGQPKALAPAIEIVSIRYSRPEDLTAVNLVACNLAADAYLVGTWSPWPDTLPGLGMTLTRDSSVINQTNLVESLGPPHAAVPWILQEARSRGFVLEGDTLLLTGACGKVVAAEPGQYQADYGDLGTLNFMIK